MIGKIKSLRELFEIELRYAYDCERKLAEKGIPSMIEAASSPELRNALEHHLQETRRQISRLEQVFSICGCKASTKDNDVLDEMTSAAKDSVSHIDASVLRDAALIVNANQVEHYERTLYGSLIAFARQLGFQDAVGPLDETLREEKAADAKLTEIGETSLNAKAAHSQAAD
jgi:ferritin-like metal-binding protein YciE